MHALLATAIAKAATTTTTIPKAAQTTDHSIFSPIAKPIADVLAAFYSLVPNYGVAIILLSVAWMIIIAPLTLKSTRSMLAMQKLQPQLKKLQADHKNDRQAFAAAQMELFKEHNVSPFGSCLPTLLPLPVFFALFRVIDGLSHHVKVNGVLYADPNFLAHNTRMYKAIYAANGHINAFGLDLSKNALSGHASFLAAVPFYVLLLIMIGTQYLQTAQMMSRNPAANDNPQMKMMKYLPIFFGVICVRFPAGVILYYAMSNICRMAQQTAMYRYDPKVRALAAREVIEVEALTRDIDRRTGGGGTTGGAKGAKRPPGGGPGAGGAAIEAASNKKSADSPPARNSRFRDALAQASKQAAEGRAKKAGANGAPATKAKPASTARPPSGARPTPTKARPANGSGPKPAPADSSQPARSRSRNAPAGANPAGANRGGAPAGQNGGKAGGSPSGASRGRPAADANGGGQRPAANGAAGTKPAATRETTPKVAVAADRDRGAKSTAESGPSPQAAKAGDGTTTAPNGNGNGRATDPADAGAPGGAQPSSGSKPPRTGAGRTGASQTRTPRKRRGR